MKIIKIIDALYLDELGVQAKPQYGKYQKIHLQQGDLDGACAIYATIIALIIIKAVKYDDIALSGNEYDKRYSIEKLKKEFLELKGMHREGNHFFHEKFDNIKKMLERSYSQFVSVVYSNKDLINAIQKHIENNQPLLLSYTFKGGGVHAAVAVGIECDDKTNKPTKILCLDPSYSTPKFTYWNSVIDLTEYEGKYKFRNITESGDCYFVKLDDILIISNR